MSMKKSSKDSNQHEFNFKLADDLVLPDWSAKDRDSGPMISAEQIIELSEIYMVLHQTNALSMNERIGNASPEPFRL